MAHEHTFPDDFIWGTATAGHQVEGNNTNSDWWHWEQNKPKRRKWPLEPSGIACDSYNRYEEDFDLCVQLNNNAVRISVEWSRIEPEEGRFDQGEIDHYKKVLQAARGRGLKTFVTLNHFTVPQWFAKKGGWGNFKSPKRFVNYATKCANEFEGLIDAFITINEPLVLILQGYLLGQWPPGKINPFLALIVEINLHRAQNRAYFAIKEASRAEVGLSRNIPWYETHPHSKNIFDKMVCKIANFLARDLYIRPKRRNTDFIGLNYYFTYHIKNLRIHTPELYRSDLGWWINPKGLERLLMDLKRFDVPIYITENGLADDDDDLRKQFIRGHLIACAKALKHGTDLKGYFHWSLIDNYEWHQGFWPRFGLVEIDRENNLQRKPRPSFYYYAEICKNNRVDH